MPVFKGREPRTSDPEDRNGRKDDNVYRLVPKQQREEPVPIGGADAPEAEAITDAGVWSEGGARRIVDLGANVARNRDPRNGQVDPRCVSALDPSGGTRGLRALRPSLRILLAAATGALLAGTGLALASSSLFAGSTSALHASMGTPAHHASTPSRDPVRISLPPRSTVSSRRSARPGRRTRPARPHLARHTSAVQVVYRSASSSNDTSTVSQATSAQQTSATSSSSSPTFNATNQSASAASDAPHPGPNGALVCVSNCG
jgi:hypothetical protein